MGEKTAEPRCPTNILKYLSTRENGAWSRQFLKRLEHLSYANYAILKELILANEAEFRVVKTVGAKRGRLFCEQKRIFSDGFTYSVPSRTSSKVKTGSWENDSSDAVHDDVISMMTPINDIPTDKQGRAHCKNSIIGIRKQCTTAGNQEMIFIDFSDGKVWIRAELPRCGAPHGSRFWRELDWNAEQESFFLRSRQYRVCANSDVESPFPSPTRRPHSRCESPGRPPRSTSNLPVPDMAVALTLFEVYPFKPVAMFEVRRSVFGADLATASLHKDCLITTHRGNDVILRSLPQLLQMNPEVANAVDDNFGASTKLLPVLDLPPILFQIKTEDHHLEMGGFPWHALIQCPKKTGGSGKFSLIDCASGKTTGFLVDTSANPVADLLDPPVATFRNDSAGEILFKGVDELKVLRLRINDSLTSQPSFSLETKFVLTAKANVDDPVSLVDARSSDEMVAIFGRIEKNGFAIHRAVSKRGRKIKPRTTFNMEDIRSQFYCVNYEDDLNLSYAVKVHRNVPRDNGDSSEHPGLTRSEEPSIEDGAATLWLIDNDYGTVLKEIPLTSNWDDDPRVFDNQIEVDLETVIHTVRMHNGDSRMYIYELDRRRREFIEEEAKKDKSNRPTGRQKKYPRER